MQPEKAAEELSIIRKLMERPVKYSTQSGLAGIWAGLMALCGLGIDLMNWRRAETFHQAVFWNIGVWVGVFLLAVGGVLVLTRIRERRQNMPAWSGIKARILKAIAPPFIAGVGVSAAIVARWYFIWANAHTDMEVHAAIAQGYLIPAIWMLFYGLACWQVGEFSVIEIRVLGATFIVCGLLTALFFQNYPYEALGISFGGFHLLYGLVVWLRHGG